MRGGKRRGDRASPYPVSRSFLFSLHFPSFHLYLSSPLLFPSPFPALCTVLDNPCIFNISASSKLWTYSLAFKVLMKARRVLAPSLFPYTSSRLNSPNPTPPAAHYTIYSTSTPNLSEPPLSSYRFPSFGTEFNYNDWLKTWNGEMCGSGGRNPTGFSFASSATTTSTSTLYSYFTLLFLTLFNRSFFFLFPHSSLTGGGGGDARGSHEGHKGMFIPPHALIVPLSPSRCKHPLIASCHTLTE